MVYRQTEDALGRARERLESARERLEVARASVQDASDDLAHGRRRVETARLVAGAAAATLRHVEALLAAQRITQTPDPQAAALDGQRADAKLRLQRAHAEIADWEQRVAEARVRLRKARREMSSIGAEHDAAAREVERLCSNDPV